MSHKVKDIFISLKAGLIDEWKWKTWLRMKEEAHARGDVLEFEHKAAVLPLSFEDIQSPMLLLGFTFALTFLLFLAELMASFFKK